MEIAISARNVTLRLRRTVVVARLGQEVPNGSLFGRVAPSGSGKATIMRTVLGLVFVSLLVLVAVFLLGAFTIRRETES